MAQIIPLSEGSFTVDRSKAFTPFDIQNDNLQERSHGSLLVEVQPFLLILNNDYIVIDTGLGFNTENGTLQLHHNLIQNNVQPEQVTKVLMSHLHKDHTGGMSMLNEENERVLSFPNATYYVNKDELDYAFAHEGSSYRKDQLEVLVDNPQVQLYDNYGEIDGYIHHELSGGHCPYHQVFRIEDKEGIYFYGGDEAPQYGQLQRRFIAKYDYDGRKSMELRQKYFQRGKEEGWTFMFYHDIKTPFIHLKNSNQ